MFLHLKLVSIVMPGTEPGRRNEMLNWLKRLKRIVTNYDTDLRNANVRIAELEKLVKDRTNIAVDAGFKSASHVIVIGRYRNADYVQTYELNTPDMKVLIDQLRQMERYGDIIRVDGPPVLRAVFERDRSRNKI